MNLIATTTKLLLWTEQQTHVQTQSKICKQENYILMGGMSFTKKRKMQGFIICATRSCQKKAQYVKPEGDSGGLCPTCFQKYIQEKKLTQSIRTGGIMEVSLKLAKIESAQEREILEIGLADIPFSEKIINLYTYLKEQ